MLKCPHCQTPLVFAPTTGPCPVCQRQLSTTAESPTLPDTDQLRSALARLAERGEPQDTLGATTEIALPAGFKPHKPGDDRSDGTATLVISQAELSAILSPVVQPPENVPASGGPTAPPTDSPAPKPAGAPAPAPGSRTANLGPEVTIDLTEADASRLKAEMRGPATAPAPPQPDPGAPPHRSPTGTEHDLRYFAGTVDLSVNPLLGHPTLAMTPAAPGMTPPAGENLGQPPADRSPTGTQYEQQFVDSTVDSATIDLSQVTAALDNPAARTAGAADEPPRRSPTGTEIDARFFDQTVDSDAIESATGGDKTNQAGVDAATIESGFLPPADSQRLVGTLSSQVKSGVSGRTSLRAVAPPSHQDSKLVIKTRTLRDPRTVHNRASDYEILELLGEGGMGVVYAARQASIDRTVAVKMLKAEMTRNVDHREKFLSEAVVTGDLDHPNIVPIYDLGANEAGALFYSMKRVVGTPWIKVLRKKTVPENVEILMKVADAIAFAHARGIVHRDIKPENIMLGEFGEVLVMDWGLAMSTAAFRKAASITQSCSMGGTPAYMAPEMATGPIEKIGPSADVYLLGAVLYEIVAGKPPHHGSNVMNCLVAAARNEIQPTDHSGELVSIALNAMATSPADRYLAVQDFQNAIRQYQSHSDSIVLSNRAEEDLATAERTGDYQIFSRSLFAFEEALAFWGDNARARSGLAAGKLAYAGQAHAKGDFDLGLSLLDAENPAHTAIRAQLMDAQRERDARKHRLRSAKRIMVGLTVAVVVIISGALVEISSERDRALLAEKQALLAEKQALASEQQAHTAEKQATLDRDKAKQAESRAVSSEHSARQSEREAKQSAEAAELAAKQAREAEQKARLAEQQARADRDLAQQARDQAQRSRDQAQQAKDAEEYESYVARIGLIAAKIDENAFDKAQELLAECKPEFRHWEWGRLAYLCRQSVHTSDASAPIDAVAWFPGEKRFVTGAWDGQVRIWKADTSQLERSLPYGGLYVHGVAVSPDGRFIAAVGNDPRGYIKIWDAQTGDLKQQLGGHTDSVLSVTFSRDGKRLLTSSYDKTARLWNWESGKVLQEFRGHTWWVWSATFSPDEKRIVTTSQDSKVIVWQVASGEPGPPFTGHVGPVYSAAFSPDGQWVASGGYDKRVLVWQPDHVQPFDFEKVFSTEANPPLDYRSLEGHLAAVRCVRFSHDGRLLVSGAHDNALRIWDVRSGKSLKTMRGHAGWVRSCAFSADSHWVLSGSHDHLAKLWNIEGYEEERVMQGRLLEGHADAILSAHFAPDGQSIATSSRDRTAKTWDFHTGHELRDFEEGHEFLASTAIFFPEGKQVLTAAADNTVRIWDVQSGTQMLRLDRTGRSAAAALSHNALQVLTGSDSKQAKLWDATTGQLIRALAPHKSNVTAVAFSSKDGRLMAGDTGGHCVFYDAQTGNVVGRLEGHSGRVCAAIFLPGDRRLLTASSDKTVAQWNLETGKEEASLVLRHPDAVTGLALAPDGRHAVTLCDDGALRLWDIDRAKVLRTITPPGSLVDSLALSPDGRHVVTVSSRDRAVRQWDLATGKPIVGPKGRNALLELKTGLIWSAAYSNDGNFLLTVGGSGARMWEVATGLPGISLSPHGAVASANFSPDGKRLVTASWDNSAKIWDAATGRPVAKLEGAHNGYVNCAVFSPAGDVVLTASDDHTAKLWNAGTARVAGTLEGHADRVRTANFSVDGHLAVTASADKTARIWDVDSLASIQVLTGHDWGVLCASFSHDGSLVITGSEDNSARIWDAKSGESVVILKGHTAAVNWVGLSRDGRRALTASQDNTVKLWDAATGKELLTLRGHSQEVTAVEFSADSHSVLTGSRDGTAIIWLGSDWRDAGPDVKAATPQQARAER